MATLVCDTSHQIESVAFCPQTYEGDAPLIAVSSSSLEGSLWGGALSLIDALTCERLCATTFACGISAIAWCGSDHDTLACCGDDGIVRLIRASMDVDFRFITHQPPNQSCGHDDIATCVATCPAKPSQFITGSFDTSIKCWDASSVERCVHTYQGGHAAGISDVAWNDHAPNTFASAGQDGYVQVWDCRAESPVLSIRMDHAACSLDWYPQSEFIASVGLEDGTVVIYDVRSPALPINAITEHVGCVYNVKYAPMGGDVLATASDDSTVRIVQNATKGSNDDVVVKHVYTDHTDYVRGMGWASSSSSSGDLPILATGSWDKSLHIWRPKLD